MKVLVLGATGFIGFPAAQAFVRSGHEVYGQTRNAEKVKLLQTEEIIPVVADPSKGEEWAGIVEKVDVVLNCIGGMDIMTISRYVFDIVSEAATKARGHASNAHGPRLTYIYCSGAWNHGEDRANTTSELSVPKNTIELVKWRIAQEQRVLGASANEKGSVNGVVVRPSGLYGRSGSIVATIFGKAIEAAQKGVPLEWAGREGGRWALIHVDDLADLFVRVAEKAPICKGLVFDASNAHSESVSDILNSATALAGAPGWTYRAPAHAFEEAIATTILLRPSLARALLGWEPKKPGLVDGMRTYWNAYKAFL